MKYRKCVTWEDSNQKEMGLWVREFVCTFYEKESKNNI